MSRTPKHYSFAVARPLLSLRLTIDPDPRYLVQERSISGMTACTLRLIEDSGLERGGFVCADAWFGSAMTAVEAKLRLGVYTTMVGEGSTYGFPKAFLEVLMDARHGDVIAPASM